MIVISDQLATLAEKIQAEPGFTDVAVQENTIYGKTPLGVYFTIYVASKENYTALLFKTTAASAHLELLGNHYQDIQAGTEQGIYDNLGFQYIEPELREGIQEVEWARNKAIPRLLELQDLKGILAQPQYLQRWHTYAGTNGRIL